MQKTDNMPYEKVLAITAEYLGPAAKRFVDRQIYNHLDKQPPELSPRDLPLLADWLKLSFGLLTDDRRMVDNYVSQLKILADQYASVG